MLHTVPQWKDDFHFHSPLLNKASACLLLDIHRRGIFSSVNLNLLRFQITFLTASPYGLFRSINRPHFKVDEHPRLTRRHSLPP